MNDPIPVWGISPRLLALTQAGVVAALYAALTLSLPMIGFGDVQMRVSEALTILPVLMPAAVPGLAVGCFVTNLTGLALGWNLAGAWDVLFGTLATLAAALLTRRLRHVRVKGFPLAATLPPVILNALIVGAELSVVVGGMPWYLHMLCVAAGQTAACAVLGGGVFLLLRNRLPLRMRP